MINLFIDETGTVTTSTTSSHITDSSKSFGIDYYKGWQIRSQDLSDSNEIKFNTETAIYSEAALNEGSHYVIEIINKNVLDRYSSILKTEINTVTDDINNSINEAKTTLNNLLNNKFQKIIGETAGDNTYILFNLAVLVPSLAHYALYRYFSKNIKSSESNNEVQADAHYNEYKLLIDPALNLIHIDSNRNNTIDSNEMPSSGHTVIHQAWL